MKIGDTVYLRAGTILAGHGRVVGIDWRTRDTQGAETLIVDVESEPLQRVSARQVFPWNRSDSKGG